MLEAVERPAEPTALRLRLLANGWIPIPVAGKRPMLKAWQTKTAKTLTPNEVRESERTARNQHSTGLICGKLAAVDIDVPIGALAEPLRALAAGVLGPTPFLRIGRAPKLALCYRVTKPGRKLVTPALFMPDGTKVQIEVLSAGQQIVGYGIHPDTKRPYEWPGAAPHTSSFADVPETTTAALEVFVAKAEAFLRSCGAREKGKPKGEASRVSGGERRDGPNRRRQLIDHRFFDPPTVEDVQDALSAVPNNSDWHTWHKIGAAIYDALGDDGESMFDAWSRQSDQYNAQATKQKWASYRTSASTVKVLSLFWAARRNGWKSKAEREREEKARKDSDRHVTLDAASDDGPELPNCSGAERAKRKRRAAKSAAAAALLKGRALVRDGASFEQMLEALNSNPETAAWMGAFGSLKALSEARRIFDAALPKGPLIRLRGGKLHQRRLRARPR